MTKGMAAMLVYTTKECNYNSIVIVHQHGGYHVTCISLVKSKIGLLREITRILFCERNKKSEKGLIAD